MKIAIRVDASSDIGTGHLMRCLTLADALAQEGHRLRFVCRHLPDHLGQMIEQRGHGLTIVGDGRRSNVSPDGLRHANWLGVSQEVDAEETISALAGERWDWLIVDHYALDFRWESRLRKTVDRVLAIDDIADRKHECTVLLDQNLFPDRQGRYDVLVPEGCMRLLGPRYALLQPLYADLHRKAAPKSGAVKRVLIYFGGADRHDLTGRLVEAWLAQGDRDVEVDVVLPAIGARAETLRAMADGSSRVRLHESLPSLASLMAEADLCIGASGATNWERLCLGLPSLVVTLAENQIPVAQALSEQGLVQWLGNAPPVGASEIMGALQALLGQALDPDWSRACIETVDGLGTFRVRDVLTADKHTPLVARLAAVGDEALILEWANDPETRRNAFSTDFISPEAHRSWFRRRLDLPPHSGLYVVETAAGGVPIGQVRFDLEGDECAISYSLSRFFRGRGLAAPLISTAIGSWRKSAPARARLFGLVKTDNLASRRTLLSLGFDEFQDSQLGVMRYRLPDHND